MRGGIPILRGIEWTVNAAEHWVILGANGSGKTSLLSALTGYLTPTSGEIHLLGERSGHANWPVLRRRVGLVCSALRHLLHDEVSALEVVVGGRYAAIDVRDEPRPADVREARGLLRLVGCRAMEARPWAYLSQGERQRILIARALMAHPEVLILDEPCAGLDPIAREQFLTFLSTIGKNRTPCLVLVTHHIEEILPVLNRTLILREGRVAACGSTPQVVTSKILSSAFGARVEVRHRAGRFSLRIPFDPDSVSAPFTLPSRRPSIGSGTSS
jgi:iron complex transport system ATP-binding protein